MSDSLSRRQFLGTTAAGGILLSTQLGAGSLMAAEGDAMPKLPPAKIYRIFAGRTGDDYLTHPTEELARFEKYFAELEKKLGDVKFVGGEMVPPAEVGQVASKVKDADALLIVHLSHHGGDAPVLGKLIDVGLPTALFSQPFSGHGWMYFPQWHKQGKKVVLLPTSDWGEIEKVVGLLRAAACMKHTRILAVTRPHGSDAACSPEQVKKKLGAELVVIPNARVMDAMKAVDPKAAESRGPGLLDLQGDPDRRAHGPPDHRVGPHVPGHQEHHDPGEGPGDLQRGVHGQPARLPDVQQAERPGVRGRVRRRHRLDAHDAHFRLRFPRSRASSPTR